MTLRLRMANRIDPANFVPLCPYLMIPMIPRPVFECVDGSTPEEVTVHLPLKRI